ncbi:MAG: STAS domain-containing protein [Deltaproteobacteria bacterium]|nr:STAS domain-containing protein [Deltaproteobacteria bacterium]
MAMKTSIRKEGAGDVVIVTLEGHLDFETTDTFRESLMRIERTSAKSRIIFDLGALQFVGSSGISAFVQALRDFNSRAATKPRYTNVKSEFKKIISAFDDKGSFEFWDNTERALKSFDN